MGLEVVYGVGALLLGVAIGYALLRNSRNPRNDRIVMRQRASSTVIPKLTRPWSSGLKN